MLISKVEQFIFQKQLLVHNKPLIVANSGGIDSMVLTDILMKLNYSVELAHCNFQLRASESDSDEKFVRDIASKWNIPIHVTHFNTKEIVEKSSASLQEVARKLRYDWFDELILNIGFQGVATAHHADDVAETFLINLGRSCGIAGLHGIPPKNGTVVRPILFLSRNEIEEYARVNRICFRNDSSNAEHKYTRNKIRHEVIPILKQIFPEFIHSVSKTTELVSKQENIYNSRISEFNTYITSILDNTEVDLISMSKINNIDVILFELLKPFNFNFSQICNMLNEGVTKSGIRFQSSTHMAITHDGKLIIKPLTEDDNKEEYLIHTISDFSELPISFSYELLDKSQLLRPISATLSEIFVDLDKLTFPLKLRHWQNGNKFHPSGLNGSKKLQDFFSDLKLNLFQKKAIWILESNDEVVWIVGYRADKRFFISPHTEQILRICVF